MSTNIKRIENLTTLSNAETRIARFNITSPAVYEIAISGRVHAEGGADGVGGVVRQRSVIVVDNDFHGSYSNSPESETYTAPELSGVRVWSQVIDPGNDAGEEPGIAINIQGIQGMTIQWNVDVKISEAAF